MHLSLFAEEFRREEEIQDEPTGKLRQTAVCTLVICSTFCRKRHLLLPTVRFNITFAASSWWAGAQQWPNKLIQIWLLLHSPTKSFASVGLCNSVVLRELDGDCWLLLCSQSSLRLCCWHPIITGTNNLTWMDLLLIWLHVKMPNLFFLKHGSNFKIKIHLTMIVSSLQVLWKPAWWSFPYSGHCQMGLLKNWRCKMAANYEQDP